MIYGGSLSDAGFYLQRAVELNPNDVSFLGIYAIWLCYVGRGEETLTAIREAIKRDPHGQEWFWDVQGAVFTIQGMYQEAVSSFTKMTELPCWSRCFRAYSLMKSGDPAQARTLLKGFEQPAPDLIPSVLMDRILPDIARSFRKDLLDTLRNLEAGLFDVALPKPKLGPTINVSVQSSTLAKSHRGRHLPKKQRPWQERHSSFNKGM